MLPLTRSRARSRFFSSLATAWTPASLGASLALWLDADDASTITLNASTVSQWNDKSGNARHASQASAANQPLYSATGLNSKPTLSFDGLNDHLLASYSSVNFSGASIFVVARLNSTSSANAGLVTLSDGTNPDYLTNGILAWSSGYSGGLPSGADSRYNNSFVGVNNQTLATNTIYTYSFISNSGIWIDGALRFAGDNGTSPIPNTLTGIGSRLSLNGQATNFSKSLISDVIIINSIVSTTDRQKLEGYLAWKWGGI
jgi:hypothetical protein